jgi:outer membrane receptor protein involved in Fe transport
MRTSMRIARLVPVVWLVSTIFFLPRPVTAQSVYGQVWGRLTTVAGKPVSGASVTVTAAQTAARARTNTDAGGFFTISNLAPDLYQIDVQADGFNPVQGTVAVSADSTTTVNSTLKAGDSKAAPTQANGSALQLDRTDVATLFDSRTIVDLPLLDLNVTQLQLLVPGAARGQYLIPSNQNPQNPLPININGQHFSGSSFQVDGTDVRDPLEGIVLVNPTLDSAGEMKVTTQGYNAEFGQATAGVVTIQSKSGSNAWHGDAFGFRRTGWGQSQDPFAPPGIPPTKYEIFGGSIGGPIVRNRLFIFGDYQGTRSSQGTSLLLSVPPQHVRDTCLGPSAAAGSMCDLSAYSSAITGSAGTLVNPYNKSAPFCPPQNNVPCNEIPNSLISPQAVALLNLLPKPDPTSTTDPNCTVSSVCDNFLASGQEVFSANQFDIRSDYILNSRFRLFGRYSFGNFNDSGTPAFGSAGGFGVNPSEFAGVALTRNQGISSGFTYSLRPKLLTDFRFGYFRYRLSVDAEDSGQIPVIEQPGSSEIPNISAAETGDPFATGLPDFQIPGQQNTTNGLHSAGTGDYLRLGTSLAANSCNCPLREREQQFQFVNNWIRSSGKHIIKWGADLRYLQNYRFASDRPPTGYFSFAPSATGLGLATFLIGDVTSFQRTISSPAVANAGEHQKRFGFYGQDTWRVNPRFTLNYGLRWEIYFPQTATGVGGFLVPNLTDHDPGDAIFNTPSSTNASGGISGSLKNFAPRLGLAYLINPTTVVRAGYGRSFDAGYAGDIFGIAATGNPPVTVDQNIQSGGFNLNAGPPKFNFPTGSSFSLLDLATENAGSPATGTTAAVPSSGVVVYALPPRVRVPTVDSWNLTFQHELTSRLDFELAYVGDKGTHVFADSPGIGTYYNLNQASLQGFISQPLMPQPKPDLSNCNKSALFPAGATKTNAQFCETLPQGRSFYDNVAGFNPILFEVHYFGNNSNDNYNSLQAKVNKNFSKGLSFLAHYTWSKGLDNGANYFAVDPRITYGPDSFDIRHRFVMTSVWDVPIGRGRAWLGGIGPAADRFIGGWTISAITVWQGGVPFTPSYSSCSKDIDAGDPCQANRVGPVQILGNRDQYFTTTGGAPLAGADCNANGYCGVDGMGHPIAGPATGPWQRPGAGQIGNAGRDSLIGPSFFQSDIGLAKVIPVSEGVALRFRADAFNAFNRVNLGSPDACVDCSGGGAITNLARGAVQRRLEFSLRVEF